MTNTYALVLPGERIHHVKEASSCNYCHRYRELMVKQASGDLTEEETNFIEWWETVHHPLNVSQRAAYQKDREDVRNGCNNRHIIITHDFSKIKTQHHQHQDYILVTEEGGSDGRLTQSIYHYVAASASEKHDVRFVEYVWRELLNGTLLICC